MLNTVNLLVAERSRLPSRLCWRASGFTLIEMVIVVAILGVVMAIGVPNYTLWIQNTQVRNVAQSILSGMQRARADAVTRNGNVTFVLGGSAFWTVTEVSTGTVSQSKPTTDLPGNVSATVTPGGATTITFGGLGTVVANADASASITQIDVDSTVLAAADSRDLSIRIGAGGSVRLCDPNVSSTDDPRHC